MYTRVCAAGRWAAAACATACATLAFSASALATENVPAFGKCSAHTGGKYSNSGCTKLAKTVETEKFEWEPLTSAVKFVGAKEKETGKAVLAIGGPEISCANETAKGEYGAGNLLKNVIGEFAGCENVGIACNSEGQAAGHINTKKLDGEPGVVKKELKEEKNIDGTDLAGEESAVVAEFACGPAPVIVKGGIVTRWQADSSGGTTGEETNKMLSKLEIEYVTEKPGKQQTTEWTPNGEGVTHSKREKVSEQLEASFASGPYEPAIFSLVAEQKTSPSTVKIELRQCEKNIVCPVT